MRRAFLTVLLLALPIAGPVVAADQPTAPKTPAFETLLPGDTFFVASAPNVPSICDQLSRTALGKLMAEPEVRQFLKPGMAWLERKMAKARKKFGHDLPDLLDLFRGQVGVAVIRADPMYGGMVPDAVFYVDAGKRKADLEKLVHGFLDKAGRRVGVTEKQQNGQKWLAITVPGSVVLSAGFFGNALVITTRPSRMPMLVDAYQKGLAGNLTTNPNFKAATKRVGAGDSLFYGFVNVEAILDAFETRLPPMVPAMLNVSGVGGIKAVAFASKCVAEGIRDSMFVYVPGKKEGLLKIFYSTKGGKLGMFGHMPESAFWASSEHIDLAKVVDDLIEMAGKMHPMVRQQIEMGMGQMKQMLGVDLRTDVLKPLGDELGFYAALPPGGGFIPDMVVLAKTKDPALTEKSLSTLVEKAGLMYGGMAGYRVRFKTLEFMGQKIHYLDVENSKHQHPFPVTPSFVVDGDMLAIALFPQPLKEFLARGDKSPTILDRPDFIRVMKGLPAGMTSVEYIDLGAAFRWFYGTLVPVLQAVGKFQKSPLDPALLPRTETIAKHLFGAAWGLKAAGDGIEFHGYSQAGMLPAFVMGMAPMLFIARAEEHHRFGVRIARASRKHPGVKVHPVRHPARHPARHPVPATAGNPHKQLKEIYIALLYQFAETGSYAKDFDALVKSKALESAHSLLLKGDPKPLATPGGLKTSFVYVGPKVGSLKENSDKAVWVYERKGLSKGTRWVLFGDGSVRRIPEKQFAVLLAQTEKRTAK